MWLDLSAALLSRQMALITAICASRSSTAVRPSKWYFSAHR